MSKRILSPFTPAFDKLPNSLPIFPLPNAMLLPSGRLPLNIFEPRYLNMISDALKTDALIGMIQPLPQKGSIAQIDRPPTFSIGCAGRITDYSETPDGRIEIVLTGVCRFSLIEELPSTRGYRVVMPDWSGFEIDYEAQEEPNAMTQEAFLGALKSYMESHEMEADWELFEKLSIHDLSSSLINVLPISTDEKQMLLETDSLANRIKAFAAILGGASSSSPIKH